MKGLPPNPDDTAWLPGQVTFPLDGAILGSRDHSAPPAHWHGKLSPRALQPTKMIVSAAVSPLGSKPCCGRTFHHRWSGVSEEPGRADPLMSPEPADTSQPDRCRRKHRVQLNRLLWHPHLKPANPHPRSPIIAPISDILRCTRAWSRGSTPLLGIDPASQRQPPSRDSSAPPVPNCSVPCTLRDTKPARPLVVPIFLLAELGGSALGLELWRTTALG